MQNVISQVHGADDGVGGLTGQGCENVRADMERRVGTDQVGRYVGWTGFFA